MLLPGMGQYHISADTHTADTAKTTILDLAEVEANCQFGT